MSEGGREIGRRAARRVLGVGSAALMAAGVLHAAPAMAATRVFNPSADTYVSSAARHANFGSQWRIKIDGRPRRRAFLRFDVTLPHGAVVSKATLSVYPAGRRGAPRVRVFHSRGLGWEETKVTYAHQPRLGRALGYLGRRTRSGAQRFTLRGRVRPGHNTIALTTRRATLRRFWAREGRRPARLSVTYTAPPPPSPPPPTVPPPPASSDPVVLAAGDIQPAAGGNPTVSLLNGTAYNALLPLGDNQYEAGAFADYDAYYATTWGLPAHKRRTYPVPGNREARSDLTTNYCAWFRGGSTGPAAVDPCAGGRRYYSYDLGAWHIVALDSTNGVDSGTGWIDGAQRAWLRADLATHPAACTLAYWHHPRYGRSDISGTLNGVWDDLMAAHVELVLVGHEHNYQRYAPMNNTGGVDRANGVREFVVGTGGRSFHPVTSVPGQELTNDDTFGVLRLGLHPTSYDWKFLPEPGATFTDSGTEACR